METSNLTVALSNDPLSACLQLQIIKDAMVQAMMLKIECIGIQDAKDKHFAIWQTIYLEADHLASTIS